MNQNHTYCIIMAGGAGTRFWPMSRSQKPKQFIDILGTGKTLIQQTYERLRKLAPAEHIYVVTHELYRDLVLEQLDDISESQVLLEPARRNTAPCIAYANHKIKAKDEHAVILVAPSDHVILKEEQFLKNSRAALRAAASNPWLLTFGIRPSRPDTGYGYIQYLENMPDPQIPELHPVKTFTEKPNIEIARSFIESGDFLWNSGIFIWSLDTIDSAFREHLPEVNQLFEQGKSIYHTADEMTFINKIYPVCRNISIDYGIMEKAQNVMVMDVDFGWSDLGTWGSLYDIKAKDDAGNTLAGKHIMIYESHNNIINISGDKLVVIQGLEDYIVVDEENALLICKKTEEQQIRQFVTNVKVEKGEKFV